MVEYCERKIHILLAYLISGALTLGIHVEEDDKEILDNMYELDENMEPFMDICDSLYQQIHKHINEMI